MVGLKEALSYPSPRVRRLLGMAEAWRKSPVSQVDDSPSYEPKQLPSLAERLGESGIRILIAQFLAGTTKKALADLHNTSESSIKRLLQARDVRLWKRMNS